MLDDTRIRLAAFRFLEEQERLAGDEGVLPRKILVDGFVYEGHRVPLMGPQGIFKPRVLREIPLSITTVAVVEGETRPYDDAFGEDGLLRYRYRGTDPRHHENVGLRLAMQRRVPLIYFHGIVPGLYVAEWPVYIVGDDPERLTFTVSVEDRRFASLGTAELPAGDETEIRRRYATRLFRGAVTHSPRASVWICVALTPSAAGTVEGVERLDLGEAGLAEALADDGLVAGRELGAEHLLLAELLRDLGDPCPGCGRTPRGPSRAGGRSSPRCWARWTRRGWPGWQPPARRPWPRAGRSRSR